MTHTQPFETVDGAEFRGALFLGNYRAGTNEWHGLRRTGIGGSDVGTILGLNPWESAFGLWAKRTGQIADPPVDNWAVRFGNAFEEPILRMWAAEHPEFEIFTAGTYRHPKHSFMLANPDALARHRATGEWVVVEVKTSRNPWSQVPPAYRAQVFHYMTVFGISQAVVVAVAGWNWEEHWVDFDQFEADAQLSACRRFWNHLEQVVKPEWDGSKATYEAQRQLNPAIDDDEVQLDDLGVALLEKQRLFDVAEAEFLRVKSEVLHQMGRARHGVVTENGVTVRVASRQARGNGTPWLVIKKGK